MADVNALRLGELLGQPQQPPTQAVTANPLMMAKALRQRGNMPVENLLTQYNDQFPQDWQQFGQNMAQAYPTPATGGTRDQILGAVKQAAMNAGPLMTVYHGSPHKFDAFDTSKIGTGEGAQSYGHGLYLAESADVARNYKNPGGPRSGTAPLSIDGVEAGYWKQSAKDPVAQRAADSISRNRNVDYAIDYLKQDADLGNKQAAAAIDWIRANEKRISQPGVFYKVDLPDEHIAKMLDWDKPLSQQPKDAQVALREMVKKASKSFPQIDLNGDMTLGQLHHLYAQHRGGNISAVSEELRAAGIPGIRYLDGGSRGIGAGTSNFVVFDDKIPKILSRE